MWNFTRTMDLFLLNQILSPLFHPLTVPGFSPSFPTLYPSSCAATSLYYSLLFLLSSSDFPYRLICFCPPNAGIFTFSKKQGGDWINGLEVKNTGWSSRFYSQHSHDGSQLSVNLFPENLMHSCF